MKQPRPALRDSSSGSTSAGREPAPTLPAWRAFVVQFTRDAESGAGIFAGRIEHLSSGRRARFTSQAELLAILGEMLDQLGEPKGNR